MVNQYDICRIKFQYDKSKDSRPWLIISPQWYIDEKPDAILAVPLSAQMDLYSNDRHFLLDPSNEELESTGLNKQCYAALDYIMPIPAESITQHIGILEGKPAEEFLRALVNFLESE